ncbi:DUF2897 family protein [Thaumasiovibrio subtropicus]|uniref:DUF2897 family protein n=1 Tax=Thaumasiovibrio subtropicus TaxID=1891207 RepID=UPI00131CCA01|nr:DUF2897 family protein [Thaumasiovibrio subtropicus]
MALLFNPWVLSIVVISVLVGNIMALKYTANMTVLPKNRELDALLAADKKKYSAKH